MTDTGQAGPSETLEPCPFCGGGETRIDERRLSPTMKGPGAVISATVKHWCPKVEGQPTGLCVSMHGRDKDAAIAAWNRRAAPKAEADLIEKCAKVAENYGASCPGEDIWDHNKAIAKSIRSLKSI